MVKKIISTVREKKSPKYSVHQIKYVSNTYKLAFKNYLLIIILNTTQRNLIPVLKKRENSDKHVNTHTHTKTLKFHCLQR